VTIDRIPPGKSGASWKGWGFEEVQACLTEGILPRRGKVPSDKELPLSPIKGLEEAQKCLTA